MTVAIVTTRRLYCYDFRREITNRRGSSATHAHVNVPPATIREAQLTDSIPSGTRDEAMITATLCIRVYKKANLSIWCFGALPSYAGI